MSRDSSLLVGLTLLLVTPAKLKKINISLIILHSASIFVSTILPEMGMAVLP